MKNAFLILLSVLFFSSCLSTRKYDSVENNYWRLQTDSMNFQNTVQQKNWEIASLRSDLDESRAIAKELKNELQLLNATREQTQNAQAALREREKKLDAIINLMDKQKDAVFSISGLVANIIPSFGEEASVKLGSGKLYMVLPEKALFKGNGTHLEEGGRDALGKLVALLSSYPEMEVAIHCSALNYDIASNRSTALAKFITEKLKYPSEKLSISAGTKPLRTVTSSKTILSHTTEIIITPWQGELFKMLESY